MVIINLGHRHRYYSSSLPIVNHLSNNHDPSDKNPALPHLLSDGPHSNHPSSPSVHLVNSLPGSSSSPSPSPSSSSSSSSSSLSSSNSPSSQASSADNLRQLPHPSANNFNLTRTTHLPSMLSTGSVRSIGLKSSSPLSPNDPSQPLPSHPSPSSSLPSYSRTSAPSTSDRQFALPVSDSLPSELASSSSHFTSQPLCSLSTSPPPAQSGPSDSTQSDSNVDRNSSCLHSKRSGTSFSSIDPSPGPCAPLTTSSILSPPEPSQSNQEIGPSASFQQLPPILNSPILSPQALPEPSSPIRPVHSPLVASAQLVLPMLSDSPSKLLELATTSSHSPDRTAFFTTSTSSTSDSHLPPCGTHNPLPLSRLSFNKYPDMISTVHSFQHRPSIASIVREKRWKISLALASPSPPVRGTTTSTVVQNSPSPSSFSGLNERRTRSRGCTRMGGLSDLTSKTSFDSFQRPTLSRLPTEPVRLTKPTDPDPDLHSTPHEASLFVSGTNASFRSIKSLCNNPRLDLVDMPGSGLGEVVMTPTTEEWWSLDNLKDEATVRPASESGVVLGIQTGHEEEDEAQDDSDESGSSSSGSHRSPSVTYSRDAHNLAGPSDLLHHSTQSPPGSFSPQFKSFDTGFHATGLLPDHDLSSYLGNQDTMDSNMEITSAGLLPAEGEPTLALATLTSVNGIIHTPFVGPSDISPCETTPGVSSALPQLLCPPPELPASPTRSSAAILNSILDQDHRPPNSFLTGPLPPRPCSLNHDGVVRKPIDPRSYSAVTNHRSIGSFVLESEAGKGAYGSVRNAREKGPDGRPIGPPLMIKFIIKQRILADCWKRHKILGPIPVEIHVLDHLRRVNYRPPKFVPARKCLQALQVVPNACPSSEKGRDQCDSGACTTAPSSPTAPTAQKTGHPSICGILDYFEDPDYYYLVMPCFGNGRDLFDYIEHSPNGLNMTEVRKIFGQLADGVAFLHERNIVHRDIKDENVILDEEGNAQLIDFGSAAYVRAGTKFETFSGTLDFAAPEVLRGERHDGKEIDVWALGVLLYVLIYGECPFWNPGEALRGIEPGTRAAEVLSQKAGLDPAATDLLSCCLMLDPSERPCADDICRHAFFLGEDGWTSSSRSIHAVPSTQTG